MPKKTYFYPILEFAMKQNSRHFMFLPYGGQCSVGLTMEFLSLAALFKSGFFV